MNQFDDKIKKVGPLVRARKVQLDVQAAELTKIRQEKARKLDELALNQQAYMNGVHRLNEERQSSGRHMLEALEHSLDHVKTLWYQALRELRTIEEQERQTLSQVLSLQTELKAAEKLTDRYKEQKKAAMHKKEQKLADELSLRKFSTSR